MSNVFLDLAARYRAAREGISEGTALDSVEGEYQLRLQGRYRAPPVQLTTTTRPSTTSSRVTPPLPAGPVDLAQARAHLTLNLRCWSSMDANQKIASAKALVTLCDDASRVSLSRAEASLRPTVLLALYPGRTGLERTRSYLTTEDPSFGALPFESQWSKVKELRTTHNLVDLAAEGVAR